MNDTMGSLRVTELNKTCAFMFTTLSVNYELFYFNFWVYLSHRNIAEFFKILFQLFFIDVKG